MQAWHLECLRFRLKFQDTMGASKGFCKIVVVIAVLMLIITACSEHNDELCDKDGGLKPNPTSSALEHLKRICFQKPYERLGSFLNNQKESPRQDLYSILQFLGTLMVYICCVLLRNVQCSYRRFDKDLLAYKVQESVNRKLQDCWTLPKAMLHPFCSRFRANFGVISQRLVSVFYLFESENQRAVSFINLKEPSPVSILHLARCGFYYVPEDRIVKCFGCGKQILVKDFNKDPSNRQFHASSSCPFVPSGSQTLAQEALGSQRGDETNFNGDRSEPPPRSIAEDKANVEPTEAGYATGGRIDISSNLALPDSPETSEVSEPGHENVASALRDLENRNAPTEASRSMREREEESNSPPNPNASSDDSDSLPDSSTTPDGNGSLQNSSTTPDGIGSLPNSSTTPDGIGSLPDSSTTPDGIGSLPNSSTTPNGIGSLPNSSTTPDDSDESGSHPLSSSTYSDPSFDLDQQPAVSPSRSAGVSDKSNSVKPQTGASKEWKDSEKFVPECHLSTSDNKLPDKLMWSDSCPKSDVHDSFFASEKVTRSNLPEDLQCPTLLPLVISGSNLTVKLICSVTSLGRPGDEAQSRKHGAGKTPRFGTGFAGLDSDEDRAKDLINEMKEGLPTSKTKKAKQFLCQPVGKTAKCYFSVQTSKHLVFDNTEAKHTEVLLEFQDAKHRSVKKFTGKGVFVIHDKVDGNYHSTLLCQSSDSGLLAVLQKERLHFNSLRQSLSAEVKQELTESCFVVSHPHGQNKTVSFGHCTIVKYALDSARRQFERHIKHGKASRVEDVREVLLYTAGTCSGSSGAPVFSCRNIRHHPGEDFRLQLTVWIHNGVEKESGLNCSVMNSYQPELTESTTPQPKTKTSSPAPTSTPTSSAPSSSAPSSDAADTSPTQGPKAPKYVAMESRLQSFKIGFKSKCKYSPLELAEAGFYFTGNDDCIRCFCCGLGLKNWRPENNIHQEHEDRMPDCSFLKAHKDSGKKIEPALLFDESDQSSESFRVSLLRSEKKRLTAKFTCKVCWKYPASEIFLSCGDAIACERCANLLFTCPLCHKPIYATVTAYLS